MNRKADFNYPEFQPLGEVLTDWLSTTPGFSQNKLAC